MVRHMAMVMVIAVLVTSGAARGGTAPTKGAAADSGSGSRSGTTTAAKRPGGRATHSNAPAKQVTARPDSTARLSGAPRRLEDVHIEGEVPTPQVLFVTARDQRRFTRFHPQRYLKTSAEVGETTPFPNRVAVTGHPPAAADAP